MGGDELCRLSLNTVAGHIRRRAVSPVELTEATLDRIARLDPILNAFVTVTGDAALAEARTAEAEIAAGGYRGPLHGVPISLKDLFLTRGVRTTAGSRVLAGFVPERDAAVVVRLRAAGAISIGKASLLEFAYGQVHPDFGPSRNPWNPAYGTAGSSSGSGAAVAAGLGFASIGSDTGGSIRGPAAYCGVVGLKPTYDLVSRDGAIPLSLSLDHMGPLARTVRDCALVLDALTAPPWTGPMPTPYADALDRPRAPLAVGVVRPEPDDGVIPAVRAALDAAAAALAGQGYRLRPVALPHLAQAARALVAIISAEASTYHLPWLRTQAEDYAPGTRERLELGTLLPATLYLQAQRVRETIRAAYRDLFRAVDLLLLPTSATVASRIDAPDPPPDPDEAEGGERILAGVRFEGPFNLTGQPAISVPGGATPEGLPIGIQLVGRPHADATLLRAAADLEAAIAPALPPRDRFPLLA